MVDAAMQLFLSIRSNVAPHLYHDVIPCLEWLKRINSSLQIGDSPMSILLLCTLYPLTPSSLHALTYFNALT